MKPQIGISIDYDCDAIPRRRAGEGSYFIRERYVSSIIQAGGIPLLLPYLPSKSSTRSLLSGLKGILISGGDFDLHPSHFGEKPHPKLRRVVRERTDHEIQLIEEACRIDMPILGICGGAQVINVALGGALYQDIRSQCPRARLHETGKRGRPIFHTVRIEPKTKLSKIVGLKSLRVNSTHHQAVKELGKGLQVSARSSDGLIEGIESTQHRFLIGVQWHPELLAHRSAPNRKIFRSFIRAAQNRGSS